MTEIEYMSKTKIKMKSDIHVMSLNQVSLMQYADYPSSLLEMLDQDGLDKISESHIKQIGHIIVDKSLPWASVGNHNIVQSLRMKV